MCLNTKELPPVEQLRAALKYQPSTGKLVWLESRGCVRAGDVAGSMNSEGYISLMVDGRNYKAHRLAYYLYHGKDIEPGKVLDHKNGDRADNRIKNLQVVTQSQNLRKKDGIKGCTFHKGSQKWQAEIRIDGKKKHLGLYETEEEARAAYVAVKKFCGLG